jgi:predicted alpha/beta superfamily hydrolase
MTKEKVYVSLSPSIYKESKALLLESQISLLNSVKILENLKELRRRKADLKMELERQIYFLLRRIDSLRKEVPKTQSVNLSSGIKEFDEYEIEKPKKVRQVDQRKLTIEQELLEVREKLRQLTGK